MVRRQIIFLIGEIMPDPPVKIDPSMKPNPPQTPPVSASTPPPKSDPALKVTPVNPAIPIGVEKHKIEVHDLKKEINSGKRSVDFDKTVCPVCKSAEHVGSGIQSSTCAIVVCTQCWSVYANRLLVVFGE